MTPRECAWCVQLVAECLSVAAALLTDVNTVEAAHEALAAMHTARFAAVSWFETFTG